MDSDFVAKKVYLVNYLWDWLRCFSDSQLPQPPTPPSNTDLWTHFDRDSSQRSGFRHSLLYKHSIKSAHVLQTKHDWQMKTKEITSHQAPLEKAARPQSAHSPHQAASLSLVPQLPSTQTSLLPNTAGETPSTHKARLALASELRRWGKTQ